MAPGFSIALPGESYDLAYDPARDLVWLAILSSTGADYLYGVSVADGSFTRWLLPPTEHNGYLSQLEVDRAGAVWVAQEYRLSRFDPATESILSIELDEAAPGAVRGALDRDNPLPGTWISALAEDDDGVLVARNNVLAISRYDSSLTSVATLVVPDEYAGARDIIRMTDGEIVALGNQAHLQVIGMFSSDGELLWQSALAGGLPESRLDRNGDALLVTGAPSEIVTPLDGRTSALPHARSGSNGAAAAADGNGGYVLYDAQTGQLIRFSSSAVVSTLQLPLIDGEVRLPPPASGYATVSIAPTISDLIVDRRDRIWYFDLDRQLLLVAPF